MANPRSGVYRAFVRDPDGGREAKQFSGPGAGPAARAWAKQRHADLAAGVFASRLRSEDTRTTSLRKDYLAALRRSSRSDSTVDRVGWILEDATAAIPDLGSEAAPAQVRKWMQGLADRGLAPATRNKYLVEVRALARWAIREERIRSDPTRREDMASVPSRLKPQWTVEELRKMVACKVYPKHSCTPDPLVGKPDPWWRLAMLLIYGGLRLDEALHLRWCDVDWSGGFLLVRLAAGARVKRDKERIVPLQSELRALLEPLRPDELLDQAVVQVSATNARRGLLTFATRAGVVIDDRGPHSFRHSYAGLMTATGVPSLLLGSYLGHSNASTTMGYARACPNSAYFTISQISPPSYPLAR